MIQIFKDKNLFVVLKNTVTFAVLLKNIAGEGSV